MRIKITSAAKTRRARAIRQLLVKFDQKFLKSNKNMALLTAAILLILMLVFFFANAGIDIVTSDRTEITEMKVYYSKGSRDKDRAEKYEFSSKDPIQVIFNYKDVETATTIQYELKLEDNLIKQSTIPIDAGEGTHYITIAVAGMEMSPGEYHLQLTQEGKKLKEVDFVIN